MAITIPRNRLSSGIEPIYALALSDATAGMTANAREFLRLEHLTTFIVPWRLVIPLTAPPREGLEAELDRFLTWFNAPPARRRARRVRGRHQHPQVHDWGIGEW